MRFFSASVDYTREPRRAAALCAAVAACVALPAVAGDAPATEAKQPAVEQLDAGMRVAVDPATGRVRALTAEEARALELKARASATRAPAAAPQSFRTPSGAIGVRLDESHMVYSVATVGEDGRVKMECVTGEQHASEAVHGHQDVEEHDHETR